MQRLNNHGGLGGHADRPVHRSRVDGSSVAVKRYVSADGAALFEEQRRLWASPFGGRRTPPGLARPVAWRSKSRELVAEWIPGGALGSRGDLGLTEHRVEESAHLLADLHRSGVEPRRRRDAVRVARSLRRKADDLRDVPGSAGFDVIVARLEAVAAATARHERPVATHGDWSPRNVLVSPDGLRLIDLDRLQHAGAARDVEYWGAWAWATLRLSGHPGSWQLAARYREAYLAHRPDARAELERTAPFHRTAALLRIAHGWSALRADPDTMASVIAVAGVVSALL